MMTTVNMQTIKLNKKQNKATKTKIKIWSTDVHFVVSAIQYSATDTSKSTAPAVFSDSVRLFSRATTTKEQNCFDKKKQNGFVSFNP